MGIGRLTASAALVLGFGGGAEVAGGAPLVTVEESSSVGLRATLRPTLEDIDAAVASGATTGFLVVVPPGAEPVLRVVEDDREPLARPLSAVVRRRLPAAPAVLAERVRAGGYDVVRVAVAPVTVGGGRRPQVHRRLRVAVAFPGAIAAAAAAAPSTAPVARAVTAVAVNGADAVSWRQPRARRAPAARAEPIPEGCADCVRIEVRDDGLYEIRHTDLAALAGFDPGAYDPRNLRLYHRGRELAVDVEGEADGRFDPGDRILFVGERNRRRFTTTSVYWLVPAATPGRRVASAAALPDAAGGWPETGTVVGTVRLEEQNIHHGKLPDPAGRDPWMTGLLQSFLGDDAELFVPTDRGGFAVADRAAPDPSQRYELRAFIAGQVISGGVDAQEVRFEVNGVTAATATWAASAGRNHELAVAWEPAALAAAGNEVRVVQPAAPSGVRRNLLDWVELDYPRRLRADRGELQFADAAPAGRVYHVGGLSSRDLRIYAVDDDRVTRLDDPAFLALGPFQPVTTVFAWRTAAGAATTRLYVVEPGGVRRPAAIALDQPSRLRSFAGDDYLVIAHPRFVAEAEELALRRAGTVVDLTDVYDEFSYGEEDSQAVRDFLSHAYHVWPQPPAAVVLVGDASFDFQNHLGLDDPRYDIPSLIHGREVYLQSAAGLRAASDAWYAMVDGDDFVPDIAIARIPAREPGQLAAYIAKLDAYEAQPEAPWMARLGAFADDDWPGNGSECYIPGTFADDLEASIVRYLDPASPDIVRRYAGDYSNARALQNDVIADFENGLGLFVFSGHGNVVSIARHHCQNEGLSILDLATVLGMSSDARLSLGVALTCDAGQFEFAAQFGPQVVTESLAERYLLQPGAGNVAWLATTTVLLYENGRKVNDALFATLYGPQPGPPTNRIVGTIAATTLLRHFAEVGLQAREVLETTVVLGDSALPLRVP